MLNYLALLVALAISTVAGFYSIIGLTAIFAAAFWPVVIMGGVLELGKIVTTVWLRKNWKITPTWLKAYLASSVVVLMFITSMGIFGYLSKAHLDQAVPTGDVAAKVAIIDEKIKTQRDNIQVQRDNITAARSALSQMDAQVSARLDRGTSEVSAERSVQIRRQQASERTALQKEITRAQTEIEQINANIAKLNEERAPIASELRKVEAEVGPIKYVAALIYGDDPDENLLERAVRWVIIILVAVFDPLAICLVLAVNTALEHERRKKLGLVPDEEAEALEAQKKRAAASISEVTLAPEQMPDKDPNQMELGLQSPQDSNLSLTSDSTKSHQWFSTLTDWSKSPVLNALSKLKKKL